MYDLIDIKKEKMISETSFSAEKRSVVTSPKSSREQYTQNRSESQAENSGSEKETGSRRQMRSTRDSEGNELSEAQQEYFKDSKVRDASGNLLVMYHGTNAEFMVFDPKVFGGRNGRQEGFGIYLASAKSVAQSYGDKTIAGYVNIKNPASSDRKTIKLSNLARLIKTTCEEQALQMAVEDGYDSSTDALPDTWISNYTYTYEKPIGSSYREVARSIIDSNDSDMEIVQEVMAGMGIRDYEDAYAFYDILRKELGFDGFMTEWESVDGSGESSVMR